MSLQRMQYSRHDLTVSNSLRPSGCPKEILKFCYMISWTRDENTAIYAVFWHIVIITSSRYMWWIVIYVWKKLRSKMNNKISIFFFWKWWHSILSCKSCSYSTNSSIHLSGLILQSRYIGSIAIYLWKKLSSKMNNNKFIFSEKGDITYFGC